ncbi:type III effector protein [Streptomyces sp. SP18CS02]|uniref:type III effector protein n=1 Tax=Streptomyces sp. SP18CS02 TaxID=3002531 RepID=UPI002E762931|nr:type III effector protein [Streptomyces sp. SP18CS02]MEE1753154.1 type III effector protein [Streptomyces sp. SP18CS02]
MPTAVSALRTIAEAVRVVRDGDTGEAPETDEQPGSGAAGTSPDEALAALLLLREVRHQLAGWETHLIEAAREAGASWADLAPPLGVTSRQAAERRYLRLRPGTAGTTGEQRVKATRDRRAANRTVTAWARRNAADLRRLAGQITSLTDLPAEAVPPMDDLTRALADDDAARLVGPLTGTRPHLRRSHPELAARIDDITRETDQLRQDSNDQRRPSS